MPDPARRQPLGQRRRGRAVAEDRDEVADLLACQAARQRDFLDVALPEVAGEADKRGGPLRQTDAVHDNFVADEADDELRHGLERLVRRRGQGIDAPLDERMGRRVQIRAPQRRRQPADQVFAFFLVH